LRKYQEDFEAYLAYAETPENALDAATLARWRTYLANETTMSPNTINRKLAAVKRLMKEAAVQGYTTYEQIAGFERIEGVKIAALRERTKPNARTRIAPEDMRRLTMAPDPDTLIGLRDRAILHTLASSGVRIAELANLRISQIFKRDRGYFLSVRGKNDAEYRDTYLSVEAYNAIQLWLQERPVTSEYVFTAFGGRGDRLSDQPMSGVGLWKVVCHYASAIGLTNVKPHDLRRFVGTQLARVDIRKAQKALGHKRIDTTAKHYVLDELESGLTDNLY
jgi:site-specific recombinase XerD